VVELVNRRINQILVHSYLYEIMGEPIIEDSYWDYLAKDLATLIKQYPEALKEHPYGKAFEGWTGDTASVLIPYFDETIKYRALLAKACARKR